MVCSKATARSVDVKVQREAAEAALTGWNGGDSSVVQDGTFENLLAAEGIPASAVKEMLRQLVSWKVLRGGRALLDRNRRFQITRSLPVIIDLLVEV
jgi:hypothetical protein